MGFGLPAAIGAKIARPDMIVIDVDGDASLTMTAVELVCFSFLSFYFILFACF